MGKYSVTASEIGSIPEDWSINELGEFLYDLRGGASLQPKDFIDEGIRVIPKKAIQKGGKLVLENVEKGFVSEEYYKKNISNSVDETYTITVLRDLVPSGPSIGLIVKNYCEGDYILAQGVYGFKLKNGLLEDYLVQYSNSKPYREMMHKIMVGSTQVHIRNNSFLEIGIPVPSLEEQRKISSILNSLDDDMLQIEDQINSLTELKKALALQLLTKGIGHKVFNDSEVGKIPSEWEVKQLGDLGESIIGLTYKPENLVETDGVLVLRSSNIKDNRTVNVDNKYVNCKISEKLYVKENDILICSRNGSIGLIGKCSLINKGFVGSTFGAFMTVFRSTMNNYLFHLFETDMFKKQIFNDLGATINQITSKNLNNFVFAIPPRDEQYKICKVLNAFDLIIDYYKDQKSDYTQLKEGLMQQLLTGKIRVKV